MPRFDYVTVGHVTLDLIVDAPGEDPDARRQPGDTHTTARRQPGDASTNARRQPGGGAFYSALQAARLGLRALILTRGLPDEIEQLLAPYAGELGLRVQPAPSTTTLLTSGSGSARRQRLLTWAGPIEPPRDVEAAILHLAPVARETPPSFGGTADLVGLTPQGLVRRWDAGGEIAPAALARDLLPARLDAAVLSADELPACAELLPTGAEMPPTASAKPLPTGAEPPPQAGSVPTAAGAPPAAPAGPIVAVTCGAEPTAVHVPGAPPLRVPVPAVANPRDDLGAGDVFAAAFFVALHDGFAPEAAARFANAAAAVRIAGAGPAAVGRRDDVQARLGAVAGRPR